MFWDVEDLEINCCHELAFVGRLATCSPYKSLCMVRCMFFCFEGVASVYEARQYFKCFIYQQYFQCFICQQLLLLLENYLSSLSHTLSFSSPILSFSQKIFSQMSIVYPLHFFGFEVLQTLRREEINHNNSRLVSLYNQLRLTCASFGYHSI